MSEVGRSWYHTTPAHQLDRKRFDSDLYRMNREAGIDVRLGVTARDIDLGGAGGHTVRASDGEYRCRWLVDAAGLATPIGKKLGLVESNKDNHPINSWWGRFKNIANLDLLGDMEWRGRVNHTTRTLATTHFMYGGYWIWLIPIDGETFSIGLTCRTDMVDIQIRTPDDFLKFLKGHRCMRQLLVDESEMVDFQKMHNISRQSKQVFSDKRWFLTGMSAAILDPMLSPGSALLADTNRMIGDLIETDMAGETREFERKVKAYNAFSKKWLANFFLHIKGHYHDCFDRQRANFETLLMQWFGIILPISMSENWGYDPAMSDADLDAREQNAGEIPEDSPIRRIDRVVEQLEEYLKARGLEYENNRGRFYDIEIGDRHMHNTRTFGRDLCPTGIEAVETNMLRTALNRCLARIAEVEALDAGDELLETTAQTAVDNGLDLVGAATLLKEQAARPAGFALREHPQAASSAVPP
jgi:hypothetical protein